MITTIELSPNERARVRDLNTRAAQHQHDAELATQMAEVSRHGANLVLSTIIERAGGDMGAEYVLSEDCARLQVKDPNA